MFSWNTCIYNYAPRNILCLHYYLCISFRIHSHHIFSSWWPVNEKEMKSSFSFWFVCWSSSPDKTKQKYYFTVSCLMLIQPCPTESGKTFIIIIYYHHLLSSPLKTTISNTCVSQTGGSSNFHYSWICGKNLDNIDEIMHKCSCFFKWPTCLRLLHIHHGHLNHSSVISSHTPSIRLPSTSLP